MVSDAPEDTEEEYVVTSAPEEWDRPDECNGVGDICDGLFCDGEAICQTMGDVCIPDPTVEERPFSEEFHYCLAYTCMTYEEASCVCTGEQAGNYFQTSPFVGPVVLSMRK